MGQRFFFNTGMGWTSGNKCPFSYVQVSPVITQVNKNKARGKLTCSIVMELSNSRITYKPSREMISYFVKAGSIEWQSKLNGKGKAPYCQFYSFLSVSGSSECCIFSFQNVFINFISTLSMVLRSTFRVISEVIYKIIFKILLV